MEEAGTLVPDTEGHFVSAAQALVFMCVTFSTRCENWCYNTLWVWMMADHSQNPLSQTIVHTDPTITACFSSFLWTESPGCAMECHGLDAEPSR